METRAFETSLGPIWLRGEPAAFDDDRPVVVVIAGAFAPIDAFDLLPQRLPQAAVLQGHIPGNHCPNLTANTPGVFMAAYSSAIAQLGRPTVVCGASLGGLVAMGLRAPNVRGLVVLDPLIRTSGLAYALPEFRAALARRPPQDAVDLIWTVFGISADTVETRSYAGVLDGLRTPTLCLFGAPPDETTALEPSIVTEADRALLAAHPAIRTQVAPGAGHHLHVDAPQLVLSALRFFLDPLIAGTA
ncbi:alpha/beta hydrolase [Phenylobacterium sp.]|uniref:alpha/beta fold hydrolase n=1 Tax=Phenylobacterium sp. TaxID=1871053 RepID=UPI002CDAAC9F|nr:alpha/beta hydrolase [Phenylobacterium sp.]HLZ76985.1 alpha/beta hydrolase [Phenylobacterium sp.]